MREADRERDVSGAVAKQDKGADAKPLGADVGSDAPAATSEKAPIDIQAYIGQQLRAVFEDVAKQPVPDRFLELMRQLDTK